jgi:hypothetical protein
MMYDFEAYKVGLCTASVCTSLPLEEALEQMNVLHPTGISSKWELSQDKTFKGGQSNPCPCEDKPKTHKHYLLSC